MPASSLDWLINPIDPRSFKAEYWDKRPLIVKRNDPTYYDGLLSLIDVDHILSASPIRSSHIRAIRNGKEIPLQLPTGSWMPGNPGSLDCLCTEYREGATIVLQFLHERWQPLGSLCASLAAEFSAFFQVNAYLTPSQSKGLDTHYDIHDVFVLQTEGSKHWRLFDRAVSLPSKSQPFNADTTKPSKLIEEFDLRRGDLIYIPRGYMHDAASRGEASLHLTVGINSITWGVVAVRALENLIERELQFRESLPPEFAVREEVRRQTEARLTELLDGVGSRIDAGGVIADAAQAVLFAGQRVPAGQLLDMEKLPQLEMGTFVRRRTGIIWQLTTTPEAVCLSFFGKSVQFPGYVEPQLRFVTCAGSFTAAQMPDGLDEPGRLFLLETLVREGFLTIS